MTAYTGHAAAARCRSRRWSAAVQLGWFTHVAGAGSPRATYHDTIAPAVAAEDLG